MPRKRQNGFTLIELMVAIAVLAILLAIGLPSFQGTLRSSRVTGTSNELLTALTLARSEAIRSTRGAGLCASANGTACGGTWNDGWLVWVDTNANGGLDANENVVRFTQGRGKMNLVGTAQTLAFDARGRTTGGAQNIGVKPDGYETPARFVCVGATGQARVQGGACP
jgi:type IV fimbrial biogenesis protein FimT